MKGSNKMDGKITAEINRIAKHKRHTGRDAGKLAVYAALAHFAKDHKAEQLALDAYNEIMPEVSQDPEQYRQFAPYRALYGLVTEANTGLRIAIEQQFGSGYYRLKFFLREIDRAESSKRELEKLPLIVTREQYTSLLAKHKEQKLNTKYSLCFILTRLIDAALMGHTDIPKAVYKALKATEAEPVTNSRIIENYPIDTGKLDRVYPDGARASELTAEELKERYELAIKEAREIFDGNDNYKLLYEGAEAIRAKYPNLFKVIDNNTVEAIFSFFVTDPYKEGYYNPLLLPLVSNKNAGYKYIPYTEKIKAKKPASKYEVLKEGIHKQRYLSLNESRLKNGKLCEEITPLAAFREFKADYKALYKALTDYLFKRVPEAKAAEKTPLQPFITFKELEQYKVASYEYIEPQDSEDFLTCFTGETEEERIQEAQLRNGIAIIENFKYAARTPKDFSQIWKATSKLMSIDSLAQDPEQQELLLNTRHILVNKGTARIYAYNAFMKEIFKVLDIKCYEGILLKEETFETLINEYNSDLYKFYSTIGGNDQQIATRRTLTKTFIRPLLSTELKPEASRLKAFKQRIEETRGNPEELEAIIANNVIQISSLVNIPEEE